MLVILTGEFIFTTQKGAPYTPADAVVVGCVFQINDAFPGTCHGDVLITVLEFDYRFLFKSPEWEYLLLGCERFAIVDVRKHLGVQEKALWRLTWGA
jgi:hypothetical protein